MQRGDNSSLFDCVPGIHFTNNFTIMIQMFVFIQILI